MGILGGMCRIVKGTNEDGFIRLNIVRPFQHCLCGDRIRTAYANLSPSASVDSGVG